MIISTYERFLSTFHAPQPTLEGRSPFLILAGEARSHYPEAQRSRFPKQKRQPDRLAFLLSSEQLMPCKL